LNLTHLNRGGLQLSKPGIALLVIAVWEYDHIPDPPISTNCRSTQNAEGKSVFGRGLFKHKQFSFSYR
ncbi:unnamed protein product, partial [Porites evermanni]